MTDTAPTGDLLSDSGGRREEHVVVTGCAGFIGSHLTESLLADGVSVVGIDCFNSNYGRAQKLQNLEAARDHRNFQFIPVDLSRGDISDLVVGADTVYHLAAEPGVRTSWGDQFERYVTNNIVATQRLLRALVTTPEVRLVYASSSSVYGNSQVTPTTEDSALAPVSPYGLTKLSGEHLCGVYHQNFDLDVVSLRYFTVFGPRQRPDMAFHIFLRAAIAGEEVTVFGSGNQTRDFTHVSDVVAATRAAGTRKVDTGGAYNVGGGLQASIRQVLEVIQDLASVDVAVRFSDGQHGDVRDTSACTEKARDHLGFVPSTTLREGIADELTWLAGARP